MDYNRGEDEEVYDGSYDFSDMRRVGVVREEFESYLNIEHCSDT